MADKYKGKLAVIGLGFVGLPLSVTLAEKGFQVYGIDVDVRKIASLNQKISYIDDISQERLEHAVENQSFIPTDDYEIMKSVQSIIVCVPTPLTKDKNPDLKYVESAGAEIAKHLQKGQLVILESSTFPGTTKEVLLPLLEKQGLQAGIDFFLANSPERIDPGNKQYAVTQIPKVVGGVTAACQKAAHDLYSQVYDQVVLVSSTEAAELTKLLENTFRFVNISFMNEMAVLCDDLNINIWEVIDAAATKPYGYTPFYPGPGIGGHCIPVDPLYLQWKLLQSKKSSDFISLSDNVNVKMVHYVVNRTNELLSKGKDVKSAKVLLYGVTYKKDVADIRDSTAVEVFEEFLDRGTDVYYHDPLIHEMKMNGITYKSADLTEELLKEMDCVVILTDHTQIPLSLIEEHAVLIFDTRNATRKLTDSDKLFRLGDGKKVQ
ncbi:MULTISPECIES: nucleotide sugar dehydrogenase [Metabacillus]|uniref:Nucleotide sugar dehydrogenase n=1 Tax=Metabacillus hrfriensis TaxID=3048891 RepID=A0ACD4R5F2_9BACI|nr:MULTISPECIES: nucleotide sugar dehydrogenase [Metabacillus]USK26445.1 nucleotide sugar dehydrogenase [Bacillus sp. CMF21]WHZ55670.1 nucleotide sugar dehydrogenase [Metabacillus sp. CT-WN-B3]